jgi:hypothetical protein
MLYWILYAGGRWEESQPGWQSNKVISKFQTAILLLILPLQGLVTSEYQKVRDEAKRDQAKWNSPWDVDRGYEQLITEQLPIRKSQLYDTYGPGGEDAMIPGTTECDWRYCVPFQKKKKKLLCQLKSRLRILPYFFVLCAQWGKHHTAIVREAWVAASHVQRQHPYNFIYTFSQMFAEAQPSKASLSVGDVSSGRGGFVEIVNDNEFAVDVSNWKLSGGGVNFQFVPGTVIPASDSVYVAGDVAGFKSRQGGQGLFVVGPLSGNIPRSGDGITISAAF